jgi:spore coat polysaccharide biosynthesis protein SpsF (cytidylyltransferase family)
VAHTVVATTTHPADDPVAHEAHTLGVEVYRGSEHDVLDRFVQAARPHQPTAILRTTADCPLIDPSLMDAIAAFGAAHQLHYCTNSIHPTYPNGFDAEWVPHAALLHAHAHATLPSEREHVMPYIWNRSTLMGATEFCAASLQNPLGQWGHLRLTVDNPEDYELVCRMVDALGPWASWRHYTEHLLAHPELQALNRHLARNEGYALSVQRESTQ